mmetsp:Transcript_9029/g.12034  ORF Transcript_9029/g.12034 Transcript_9029/m.12034 type:complete len:236 (+) Transcript_9029:397-1104(+)
MHFFIIDIIRVRDHWVNPWSFVIRVGNSFCLPRTFVIWVVNHWRFPFSIVLIIPIIWLCRIRIRNVLWDIIVTIWFLVIRIIHLSVINPIRWLGLVRVLDFFLRKEIKLVLKLAAPYRFVVNKNLECVVSSDDECVQMGEVIGLGWNILLDKKIIVLIIRMKDDVCAFIGVATNVRTKHYGVWGVSSKISSIEVVARKKLNVSSTTIEILFMLHRVLKHKILSIRAVEGLGQRST